jgi:hypothetical protein
MPFQLNHDVCHQSCSQKAVGWDVVQNRMAGKVIRDKMPFLKDWAK